VTPVVLTSSASRPTDDFVSLVTAVVSTSSASRPTNNSVGLVSSSGDVNCVDVISFKTHEQLRWPGFIFR
ncbi:hypothetical protein Taro_035439, partial [Colocasia esculenta]|nr:hypothetical protein [Colocasia esculenta]